LLCKERLNEIAACRTEWITQTFLFSSKPFEYQTFPSKNVDPLAIPRIQFDATPRAMENPGFGYPGNGKVRDGSVCNRYIRRPMLDDKFGVIQ
jgi:hypothetical protein